MMAHGNESAEGRIQFRWSLHALREVGRRGLEFDEVEGVVVAPEQVLSGRPGREVRQSRDDRGRLVRVIMDTDEDPALIVTAYRTTKIQKYWRPES